MCGFHNPRQSGHLSVLYFSNSARHLAKSKVNVFFCVAYNCQETKNPRCSVTCRLFHLCRRPFIHSLFDSFRFCPEDHGDQNIEIVNPVLQTDETNIECVDYFNYICITIKKHLNWDSRRNKIADKIGKISGNSNYIHSSVITMMVSFIFIYVLYNK